MLIFSAKASDLPEIISSVKFMDGMVSNLITYMHFICISATGQHLTVCTVSFFCLGFTYSNVLQVDPHLNFSEDSTLHATYKGSCSYLYGSKEDDIAAMEFLEKVERDDKQLKESVISHLMKKYEKLPEVNPCIYAHAFSLLPNSDLLFFF